MTNKKYSRYVVIGSTCTALVFWIMSSLAFSFLSNSSSSGGLLLKSSADSSSASSYIGSYPIYEDRFTFLTTSQGLIVNFGTSIEIYNFTYHTPFTTENISAKWSPSGFSFFRNENDNITVRVRMFLYIDPGVTSSSIQIIQKSGASVIKIINLNDQTPVMEARFLDTKIGAENVSIPTSNLTAPGPKFVVNDTLRGSLSKHVFAFYYATFSPTAWTQFGRNCTGCSAVTGVPTYGFYDSWNTSVIDWQIEEAKSIGISAFISSWGFTPFEDQGNVLLFQEAQKLGFNVTFNYEGKPLASLPTSIALPKFVADLKSLIKNYSSYSILFRIRGQPVIFVYAVDYMPLSFWQQGIREIKQTYPNVLILGDTLNLTAYNVFDGLFRYAENFDGLNTTAGRTNNTFTTFYDAAIEANLHNKLWLAPVTPGFDNVNDAKEAFLFCDRLNGLTFARSWDIATNASADSVVLTSWNAWYEGTNIEPAQSSPDHWSSSTQYLNLASAEISKYLA